MSAATNFAKWRHSEIASGAPAGTRGRTPTGTARRARRCAADVANGASQRAVAEIAEKNGVNKSCTRGIENAAPSRFAVQESWLALILQKGTVLVSPMRADRPPAIG
jgi:hypothetical protein